MTSRLVTTYVLVDMLNHESHPGAKVAHRQFEKLKLSAYTVINAC